MSHNTPMLDHFLDLVIQGQRRGCSSGERQAHLLARAILDHAPGLDASATAGLIQWIGMVQRDPYATRQILDG